MSESITTIPSIGFAEESVVSDSATKIAMMEEEKRKMMAELAALRGDPVKPPVISESAAKIAMMEEEKRKMMAELAALRKGDSSDLSESARREILLREEVEMMRRKFEAMKADKAMNELKEMREIVKAMKDDSSTVSTEPVDDPEIDLLEKAAARKSMELERIKLSAELASRGARETMELKKRELLAMVENPELILLEKAAREARENFERKQKGLDLCIIMDCTASMSSWMKEASQNVVHIIDQARNLMKASSSKSTEAVPPVRIAFVGYRDHCDTSRLETFPFVETNNDVKELQNYISKLDPTGGGDIPEDIAGAFNEALSLNWMSSTKLIVHVADAPCHGKRYHTYHDTYPAGDPTGLDPEDLLRKFASHRVDYYFMKITNGTNQMLTIFENCYKNTNRNFKTLDVGDDASKFVPAVLESLSCSIDKKY